MGASKRVLVNWFRKKVIDPTFQIFSRGIEPHQLAFSAALGFTIGIFPICGVTVIICGMAIAVVRSRCNAPAVMLANLIATPMELSLLVPFLRFGETLTGGEHFPLTSDALKKVLTGQASTEVLLAIARALLGWVVAAPFIFIFVYIASLPCFKILVRKFGTGTSSPKKATNSGHAEVRVKVNDFKLAKQ